MIILDYLGGLHNPKCSYKWKRDAGEYKGCQKGLTDHCWFEDGKSPGTNVFWQYTEAGKGKKMVIFP